MPLGNGFLGDIGVDRRRADTDQHGKMMHVQTFAGGHIDRRKCAQLLAHKMRMHGTCRQDHRQRRAAFRNTAVGQHHMLASRPDSLLGLGRDPVHRSGEVIRTVNLEGAVDHRRLIAKIGTQRVPFRHRQDRRVQHQMITLLLCLVEDVTKIAKPCAKRHHMALTQAVDRRVGHLREILPEKMMQPAIAVGQHRQRCVIAHRPDRLLAGFGHRLQDQFEIFHRPAGHHLAAAGLDGGHPRGSLAGMFCQHRFHLPGAADPFRPVTLASQFGGQVGIEEHLSTLQVDTHHLAGTDPSTLDNTVLGNNHHAGFRTGDDQPVIGHDIAHRAEAVPVHTGNNPVVGIGGDSRWPVPRLHHRIAIGIELGKLMITANIDGGRDHHGLHHRQGTPPLAQKFEHRVKCGRIRASPRHHRLQIINGIAKDVGRHAVLMTGHPVLVATDGVDLAIMRQHAERLRQLPGRHGVGRITLVIDREGRDKARIIQIREKGRHLLGKEHTLIDDRSAGHRTDVEIRDQLGSHSLFNAATDNVELSLGLGLVDIGRHRKHDLLDLRAGGVGLVAKRFGVDRHLPPSIDDMADSQNFLFDDTAAAFLCRQIGARQEHHADSQPAAIIIMAGTRNMLDEEIARYLDMDSRAVTCHTVGINRTTMPDGL